VVEMGGSPRARGSLDCTGIQALVEVFIEFADVVQPTILRLHANRIRDDGVDCLCELVRAFSLRAEASDNDQHASDGARADPFG